MGYDALTHDPLASWIEDTFGITEEPESGRLIRRPPTTVSQATQTLSELTAQDQTLTAAAIRATLLAGSHTKDPDTDRSLFAFRLHQFISKGNSIYTTAEPVESRAIEEEYQVVLPGTPERRLYPLAFCRECGQEYLMVSKDNQYDPPLLTARNRIRIADDDDGYLFVSDVQEWPSDPLAEGRLPGSWIEDAASGPRVRQIRRKDVPKRVRVTADGFMEHPNESNGTVAAFIPGILRFCLHCGVSYESRNTAELAKVATLDTEGRSSAMTVIASSIVKTLRGMPRSELAGEARKLLTFVDNRQDASLQAGHLNDFVQVVRLRGAIYQAAQDADPELGLEPVDFGSALVKAMKLDPSEYALAPKALDQRNTQRALRGVVEYRALMDLRKGWRVTLPNLEQTGLIRVDYPFARPLAESDDLWEKAHPRLQDINAEQREEIIRVCLDEFRRNLAIEADALSAESFERLRRLSRDTLSGLWSLPIGEPDPEPGLIVLGPRGKNPPQYLFSMTGRGAFGRWLRGRFEDPTMKASDVDDILDSLLRVLTEHGLTTRITERGNSGYRINASALTLRPGDGRHGAPDPVRRHFDAEAAPRVVPYFKDLYRNAAQAVAHLQAAEHTAQVGSLDRQEREREFRTGELPLLFCSPTMELGVDIADLNAVAMRNVPPTPANYAQRSGRAGRSGQQAIVVTYCASGNAHDSYYFARSHLMVSGKVQPPRLDLANADLVRSHVQAVWLAEALAATEDGLGRSLAQVLDMTAPGLPVRKELAEILADPDAARRATAVTTRLLNAMGDELSNAKWWNTNWIDQVVSEAPARFDAACQRWRDLYTLAATEKDAAHALNSDPTVSPKERDDARRRYGEASRRVELLLNESDAAGQSDFYTYRYLASEGFLPGYSFPRLPLSAYIPGSRGKDSNWLQRSRFLAIREFGPGALIYHEGTRYQVTRIALPRGGEGERAGEVILSAVKVCTECGYHHPQQVGLDVCESCGAPLRQLWQKMLQLQQVLTRPRRRISADEEERNRIGYDLRTTYRFPVRTGPNGQVSGRLDALVSDAQDTPIAEISYGDAAEIRVVNLGRKGRANKELLGFNLDLVKGRWLPDKGEQAGETDDPLEVDLEDVQTRDRVLPYVEDRRNIAIIRWAERLNRETAITLQYAIERGIETAFQLEDSELSSELLPDGDERGRVLLIEAAEGGAGVLRRLQGEIDAMARAASEALSVMHVDPTTGQDAEDSCVRGCYRCLLTYSNQGDHELIDRRLAIPILMRLASAVTTSTMDDDSAAGGAPAARDFAIPEDTSPAVRALLEHLRDNGFRAPDEISSTLDGIPVDLVFHSAQAAVVLDPAATEPVDTMPLLMAGWNVLHIPHGSDLAQLVSDHPSVFGGIA